MTVVILEDAAEDLETAAQFYESCATGVGNYFLDSTLSDLDSLILFVGIHPVYFGFHRMLSKRFPFGIYYEVEDDVVYVYAILDLRRNPLRGLAEVFTRGLAEDSILVLEAASITDLVVACMTVWMIILT